MSPFGGRKFRADDPNVDWLLYTVKIGLTWLGWVAAVALVVLSLQFLWFLWVLGTTRFERGYLP